MSSQIGTTAVKLLSDFLTNSNRVLKKNKVPIKPRTKMVLSVSKKRHFPELSGEAQRIAKRSKRCRKLDDIIDDVRSEINRQLQEIVEKEVQIRKQEIEDEKRQRRQIENDEYELDKGQSDLDEGETKEVEDLIANLENNLDDPEMEKLDYEDFDDLDVDQEKVSEDDENHNEQEREIKPKIIVDSKGYRHEGKVWLKESENPPDVKMESVGENDGMSKISEKLKDETSTKPSETMPPIDESSPAKLSTVEPSITNAGAENASSKEESSKDSSTDDKSVLKESLEKSFTLETKTELTEEEVKLAFSGQLEDVLEERKEKKSNEVSNNEDKQTTPSKDDATPRSKIDEDAPTKQEDNEGTDAKPDDSSDVTSVKSNEIVIDTPTTPFDQSTSSIVATEITAVTPTSAANITVSTSQLSTSAEVTSFPAVATTTTPAEQQKNYRQREVPSEGERSDSDGGLDEDYLKKKKGKEEEKGRIRKRRRSDEKDDKEEKKDDRSRKRKRHHRHRSSRRSRHRRHRGRHGRIKYKFIDDILYGAFDDFFDHVDELFPYELVDRSRRKRRTWPYDVSHRYHYYDGLQKLTRETRDFVSKKIPKIDSIDNMVTLSAEITHDLLKKEFETCRLASELYHQKMRAAPMVSLSHPGTRYLERQALDDGEMFEKLGIPDIQEHRLISQYFDVDEYAASLITSGNSFDWAVTLGWENIQDHGHIPKLKKRMKLPQCKDTVHVINKYMRKFLVDLNSTLRKSPDIKKKVKKIGIHSLAYIEHLPKLADVTIEDLIEEDTWDDDVVTYMSLNPFALHADINECGKDTWESAICPRTTIPKRKRRMEEGEIDEEEDKVNVTGEDGEIKDDAITQNEGDLQSSTERVKFKVPLIGKAGKAHIALVNRRKFELASAAENADNNPSSTTVSSLTATPFVYENGGKKVDFMALFKMKMDEKERERQQKLLKITTATGETALLDTSLPPPGFSSMKDGSAGMMPVNTTSQTAMPPMTPEAIAAPLDFNEFWQKYAHLYPSDFSYQEFIACATAMGPQWGPWVENQQYLWSVGQHELALRNAYAVGMNMSVEAVAAQAVQVASSSGTYPVEMENKMSDSVNAGMIPSLEATAATPVILPTGASSDLSSSDSSDEEDASYEGMKMPKTAGIIPSREKYNTQAAMDEDAELQANLFQNLPQIIDLTRNSLQSVTSTSPDSATSKEEQSSNTATMTTATPSTTTASGNLEITKLADIFKKYAAAHAPRTSKIVSYSSESTADPFSSDAILAAQDQPANLTTDPVNQQQNRPLSAISPTAVVKYFNADGKEIPAVNFENTTTATSIEKQQEQQSERLPFSNLSSSWPPGAAIVELGQNVYGSDEGGLRAAEKSSVNAPTTTTRHVRETANRPSKSTLGQIDSSSSEEGEISDDEESSIGIPGLSIPLYGKGRKASGSRRNSSQKLNSSSSTATSQGPLSSSMPASSSLFSSLLEGRSKERGSNQ